MVISQIGPKAGENALIWFFKIVSGVLIFAVLVIHLFVNHAIAQGGLLTYTDVVNYYKNPIVPIMEGIFLVLVIPHALVGLRGIILDMRPLEWVRRLLDWLFVLVGAAGTIYGLWLIAVIAGR